MEIGEETAEYTSHFKNFVVYFSECLLNSEHSDITISTADKQFSAHRMILGSVSDYLYNLVLQEECHIQLPEVSCDAMESVLELIYTGYARQLDERSRELCHALRIPIDILEPQNEFHDSNRFVLAEDGYNIQDSSINFDGQKIPYETLEDHTVMEVNVQELDFSCKVCGILFVDEGHLAHHMDTLHAKKPKIVVADGKRPRVKSKSEKVNKCDECQKSFAQPKDLKNHMRSVHTKERPFVCTRCGAAFAISHLLLRHQRYHLGITKYTCKECNKGFMQKNDLKKHMRTHTGERPYKCDVCNAAFARNDYLKKHKHLHLNTEEGNGETCTEKEINHIEKEDNRNTVQSGNDVYSEVQAKSFYFLHDSSGNKALHTEEITPLGHKSKTHHNQETADPNLIVPTTYSSQSLTTLQPPSSTTFLVPSSAHTSTFLAGLGTVSVHEQILPVESETIILQQSSQTVHRGSEIDETKSKEVSKIPTIAQIPHYGENSMSSSTDQHNMSSYNVHHNMSSSTDHHNMSSSNVPHQIQVLHSDQILYAIEYE
eukprot:TRINITY_DN14200_c0_g1_i23.p1 TRINITY_DN14200_c0_g1~~TRINITY_DN14200_c0_g1_i23.p1  ORF type:complete len:543 (-),score=59.06 TRINITY_DN14200_c0_g1_i23:37-1665(-)